jgi:hypothetical protein
MAYTHELKTLPQYWDAVARGDKTFEVRKDDRGFQKGDIVRLIRVHPTMRTPELDYQGRPYKILDRRIKWILTGGQFGIEPGYVVLQLEDLPCPA